MYWDHPDVTVMVDWVSKKNNQLSLCVLGCEVEGYTI